MPTKADLLAALACRPEPFTLAGQAVFLRPFDVADILAVRDYGKASGETRAYRMMFVRAVCDETGARIFDDADADGIDALAGGQINAAITRIQEINRMGDDDEGKAPSTVAPS